MSDKAYFWGLEMSLMVLRLLATALLPFCASYTHWTPNVTYCHVHMAKTAGTSLNMELANQYERVCGHKGYSFDFFQSNARAAKNPYRDIQNLADSVSKEYNEFSRERVHADIMRERGYEDCDWISLEGKWTKWKEISRRVGPLELHVPCREPVDHLMSMCNMWNHQFDCQAANITKEVGRCLIHSDRFSSKGLSSIDNVNSVRCFPYKTQFVAYKAAMDKVLENRKVVGNVTTLETNQKRNMPKECIWKMPEVKKEVEEILLAMDYYSFCNKCIGSNNDLTVL